MNTQYSEKASNQQSFKQVVFLKKALVVAFNKEALVGAFNEYYIFIKVPMSKLRNAR